MDQITPSRINHSLNICVNPAALIPESVSDLTGLTNELLENQPRFSSKTVQLISAFLENLPQPYCLVAHNGFKYDFPLLNAEFHKVGIGNLDCYILDSLQALKIILEYPEDMKEEGKALEKKPRLRDTTDNYMRAGPQTSDLSTNPKDTAGNARSSFSLESLHQKIFGVKPKKVHGAEQDVHSLIRVCASRADLFVKYSRQHFGRLSSVKRMW